MNFNLKQSIFLCFVLSLIRCGEPPTSQLTEQFPIVRSGPHDMAFAFIPSGTFRMGSSESEEGRSDIETRHWVKLTEDYWVQTTEVTIGQWKKIMGKYPPDSELCGYGVSSGEARDILAGSLGRPIKCVSWRAADDFIAKLNEVTRGDGYNYRLPSEAEWEYAARGFTETSYSLEGALDSFAWYSGNVKDLTFMAGQKKANKFGLYDVHGSVWEWVSDWYARYDEAESLEKSIKNPKGPSQGQHRLTRGGSYLTDGEHCRSATRSAADPSEVFRDAGLRIVRVEE